MVILRAAPNTGEGSPIRTTESHNRRFLPKWHGTHRQPPPHPQDTAHNKPHLTQDIDGPNAERHSAYRGHAHGAQQSHTAYRRAQWGKTHRISIHRPSLHIDKTHINPPSAQWEKTQCVPRARPPRPNGERHSAYRDHAATPSPDTLSTGSLIYLPVYLTNIYMPPRNEQEKRPPDPLFGEQRKETT
jgi:hypothetical protein